MGGTPHSGGRSAEEKRPPLGPEGRPAKRKPSPEGLGINPENDPSAVGATPFWFCVRPTLRMAKSTNLLIAGEIPVLFEAQSIEGPAQLGAKSFHCQLVVGTVRQAGYRYGTNNASA